jgi:hypothetical protein
MGKQTPESAVLAGCLRYLEKTGIYHWRNSTGAVRIAPGRFIRFGKVGSSDIEGILPDSRFLAVEVKAARGVLSPEQQEFLETIKRQGGLAVVVRGWKELDQVLREAGYADNGPLFEGSNAAPYGGA